MNIKTFNITLVAIIIAVLFIPSTYAVYTKHNDNLYRVLEQKMIEKAIVCYNKKDCITKIVTLQELYNKGYLEELIDPLSKEVLNPNITIDIDKRIVNYES